MRTLTDHIINPMNDLITIEVVDQPGSGGAHHSYLLTWDTQTTWHGDAVQDFCTLDFQNGPIAEIGVNGLTQEALLAVVIDRLACFQAGPFPSDTNARALEHCRQALMALQERTLERMARGVEGQTKA